MDRYEQMEEFKDQLELARAEGDGVAEAMALHGIARIYLRDGVYDASLDFLHQCVSVCRTNGFREHLAEALIDLGDAALAARDSAGALKHFTEAGTIYRELNLLKGLVRALARLGDACLDRADMTAALETYGEAYNLCAGNDDKIGSIYFLEKIIGVNRNNGELEKLSQAYRELITLAEKIGDRERMALGLAGLADVHQRAGQWREALPCWEMAHDIYLALGREREAGLIREHIAGLNRLE